MPVLKVLKRWAAATLLVVGALSGAGKAVAQEQRGSVSVFSIKRGGGFSLTDMLRPGARIAEAVRARAGADPLVAASGRHVAVWHEGSLDPARVTDGDFGLHAVVEPGPEAMVLPSRDGPPLAVSPAALFGARDLTDAQPGFGPGGEPILNFRFTPNASKGFGRWTTANVGERLAIVFEGEVVSAPVIREPILGGSGMISGLDTPAEATRLALALSPLPDGAQLVHVRTCPAPRPRGPPSARDVEAIARAPSC